MAEEVDFHPPWLHEKPNYMLIQDWERLTEAYWLYTSMYFRHTAITRAFLHPVNVAYVISEINKTMSKLAGEPFTTTEFYTGWLQQLMADCAYGNSALANTGGRADMTRKAIDQITGKFIDAAVTDLWTGLRAQTRFNEWALEDKRLRAFPYPEKEDRPLHSVAQNISEYTLSSPYNVGYKDFLERFRQPVSINNGFINKYLDARMQVSNSGLDDQSNKFFGIRDGSDSRDTISLPFFFSKILNPGSEMANNTQPS